MCSRNGVYCPILCPGISGWALEKDVCYWDIFQDLCMLFAIVCHKHFFWFFHWIWFCFLSPMLWFYSIPHWRRCLLLQLILLLSWLPRPLQLLFSYGSCIQVKEVCCIFQKTSSAILTWYVFCMCLRVEVCMHYICMYVCTYVRMYVCWYVCICMYVRMYVWTYVCTHLFRYVCIVHVCTYVCMYVYMYVCM